MGNRIYGCDDCLAVCPWNRFARATPHDKLRARADLDRATPRGACGPGRDGFPHPVQRVADQAHRPQPLCAQRADRHRQLRRPPLHPVAARLTGDADAVVAEAARWACERLEGGAAGMTTPGEAVPRPATPAVAGGAGPRQGVRMVSRCRDDCRRTGPPRQGTQPVLILSALQSCRIPAMCVWLSTSHDGHITPDRGQNAGASQDHSWS